MGSGPHLLYNLSLSTSLCLFLSVSLSPCLFLCFSLSLLVNLCFGLSLLLLVFLPLPLFLCLSVSLSPCLCLSLSLSLSLSHTHTHTPSWNASLNVGGDWQRRSNHAECMVSVTKRTVPRKDRSAAVQRSQVGLSRETSQARGHPWSPVPWGLRSCPALLLFLAELLGWAAGGGVDSDVKSSDPTATEDAWLVNGHRVGEVWGACPTAACPGELTAATQTRCTARASHTQILSPPPPPWVPPIHSGRGRWERGQPTPEPRSGPTE